MAKKRTTTRKGGVTVVRESARAAAPIVIAPSAAPARRRRSGGVKRRASGGGKRQRGGLRRHIPQHNLSTSMVGLATGGAILGFVEKHFGAHIPELPIVGRKGAIALAVYFLKPKNAWIQDAGKAAAAISGYELGTTGKITGIAEQM